MTVCKFYTQGSCRYGNSCRFEHPARNQQPNRFSTLAGGAGGAGNQDALDRYNISPDTIISDLTKDKPQWILSAYAPGKDAPDQLFGGYPREQSFEELKLHYMTGKASGNEQQALNEAQELYQNAQQQMENAVRNVQEAARYTAEGENRRPNRHDICREGTHGAPFGEFLVGKRPKPMSYTATQANAFAPDASNASTPFGGGAQPASSFGQPSALGQRPNPFGTPAFCQPAQPASSPFGQPSQGGASSLGKDPQPASAHQALAATGAKPNPFGAPVFGQPAQLGTQGSAFGQPSQLGQKPNPFASNPQTATLSSPFASIGNNTSNVAPTPNSFSASATGQNSNAPAFGRPAQASASPFAQASAPAVNPFATANQQTPDANNPFTQKPLPQTNGAFGQPTKNPLGQNTTQNAASTFGQEIGASQPGPLGAPQRAAASAGGPYRPGSTEQHPPLDSYSSKSMDGRLAMFKDKPVVYKNGKPGNRALDGTWTRIWFPNGPPGYCQDTEMPPEDYDEKSKAQWDAFVRTGGSFADGFMPELPPPRVCTRWDF